MGCSDLNGVWYDNLLRHKYSTGNKLITDTCIMQEPFGPRADMCLLG